MEKDFWKQIIAGLIRKLMFSFGLFLVSRGILTEEQHAGFSSAEVAQYLAGVIFVVIPILWQWAKIRFNIKFVNAAHQAESSTPLSVIKNEVLNNENKVSPL